MKSLSLSQPHAIIMVGIPGSGKTFFASKFAETFHAPYVSLERILDAGPNEDAATVLAEQQTKELLKTGASVILELNTGTRTARTELARYVKTAGYTPLLIWVQTDTETSRQRYVRSKAKQSAEFETQLQHFSPPHPTEHAVVISGKHTYASQAKIVLKRLSAPRAEISSHKSPPTRSNITVR